MAEPFKNVLNPKLVCDMANRLHRVDRSFDKKGFINTVNASLESLELKQRSDLICTQLKVFLPNDFKQSGSILLESLGKELDDSAIESGITKEGLAGWVIMPLADYVARNGKEQFGLSMQLLKEMTKRFSSEFAIRPFLDEQTQETLTYVHDWANDENEHVRRLASEGTRPRLPWGMKLQKFVQDPLPILPILEKLKDDPSEYVRRSVANNLNDISKDHPELVTEIAENWLVKASKERQKLVRHACRTLIKSGHKGALKALGYDGAELSSCTLMLSDTQLIFGGAIELTASITSDSGNTQPLMVDYIVHHQKANGTTSEKVFKWKVVDLKPGKTLSFKKKHTIKPITTRVYYPGVHKVELQINGEVVAENAFELVMPTT
ncbi:DNA alkylation repair protein [Vibrio hannami]|uniref:DNA alkylation repair protein n=1 Tax=Vibrio hannami TaxID=2717094 RepID=UPI00241067B6|nr:DNA alkylation repair protein [Vibrio hannami]MDG3086298.1 DNA alkylation repair protein [Vibrio hannami]